MFAGDEAAVRAIYKICHPGNTALPLYWYFAHPTLCVTLEGKVVGFTSFTVTLIPGFGETMYGKDICVLPEYQGRGIATRLHAARLTISRSVGVRIFMGITQPDNKAMIKILENSGMHSCIPVGDELLFVGSIEEVR
jgi:RimJ/RimL family protein N-acetyltransferase